MNEEHITRLAQRLIFDDVSDEDDNIDMKLSPSSDRKPQRKEVGNSASSEPSTIDELECGEELCPDPLLTETCKIQEEYKKSMEEANRSNPMHAQDSPVKVCSLLVSPCIKRKFLENETSPVHQRNDLQLISEERDFSEGKAGNYLFSIFNSLNAMEIEETPNAEVFTSQF